MWQEIRIASWWISSRTPSTKSSLVQWTVLLTKSWRKACILRKRDKPITGMILCNSSTQDRQAMDTVWLFRLSPALQVADGEDLSPRVAKRRLQGSPEKGTLGKGTAIFHPKKQQLYSPVDFVSETLGGFLCFNSSFPWCPNFRLHLAEAWHVCTFRVRSLQGTVIGSYAWIGVRSQITKTMVEINRNVGQETEGLDKSHKSSSRIWKSYHISIIQCHLPHHWVRAVDISHICHIWFLMPFGSIPLPNLSFMSQDCSE